MEALPISLSCGVLKREIKDTRYISIDFLMRNVKDTHRKSWSALSSDIY